LVHDLAGRRRGCSDFYPAADVRLDAGHHFFLSQSVPRAASLAGIGRTGACAQLWIVPRKHVCAPLPENDGQHRNERNVRRKNRREIT
jgi:hypothetical protein